MTKKWELSRRTFLRGGGMTLALPVLDAMLPSMIRSAQAATVQRKPRFLGFLIAHGYGHIPSDWYPSSQGTGYALPKILAPLNGVTDNLLIVGGLDSVGFNITSNIHDHSAASTFSNAKLGTGSSASCGTSVDQLAYMALQNNPNYRSIAESYRPINTVGYSLAANVDVISGGKKVGTKRVASCPTSDISCVYRHNMSWLSSSSNPTEYSSPQSLYDALVQRAVFTGTGSTTTSPVTAESIRRKGVLHYLWNDAKALNKNLGQEDQLKMQEYLDSVDQLQRRIGVYETGTGTTGTVMGDATLGQTCPGAAPAHGGDTAVLDDGDFQTRIRLISDLIVWAFQCDKTRIATHALDLEVSGRVFGTIVKNEVFGTTGKKKSTRNSRYHALTHLTNTDEEDLGIKPEDRMAAVSDIKTWEITQLAYIMGRLKASHEGPRTILDDTIVIAASGIGNPHVHDHRNVPCLFKPHTTAGGKAIQSAYVNNPSGISNLSSVMGYVLDTFEVPEADRANFKGVKKLTI